MQKLFTKMLSHFLGRKKMINSDLNESLESLESDYQSGYYSDFDDRTFSHDADKSPKETFTRPHISNDNSQGE